MKFARLLTLLSLTILATGTFGCGPSVEPADLVLRNGRIVTLTEDHPEAEALAVQGDRIIALGSNDEIASYVGDNTQVIDLQGHLAVPGLIEGHGHFMGIGEAQLNLNLTRAGSWEEIVAMVAKAAETAAPGEWIVGRGWHQEKWSSVPQGAVDGVPVHASLSQVSADHPVLLEHASGHASFVNAKAMELAGIDTRTANPEGGTIVRGADGQATGMLRETAQGLAERARAKALESLGPEEAQATLRKQAQLAAQECVSKGITSFQDAGSSFATVDLFKKLVEEKQLPLRLWVMLREGNDRLQEKMKDYRIVGMGDQRLTVRAIKRSIDGALGSHGAWLLEPYSDMTSSAGLNTTSVESIRETARLAIENDFQLCVHAIGDRANRETLDLFEEAFKSHPDKTNLRWRVEHAQHLSLQDIPRFAQLGVIASMQGIHATSDLPWVPQRLGEKRTREGAYVWQKLLKSGAIVSNGTDAPVEDVNPIASYYATVSRRLKNGEVFEPDQRMSRMEALRSYTWNAAYAAFEEDIKGSLTNGKLADITVLSRDILSVPEEDIPGTEVLYTIVGGKVVYRK